MNNGRTADGKFAVGNKIAAKSGGRGLGALNAEMLKRVSERSDLGQHVDSLLFDIAFDDGVQIETRLKAANKLADMLYTKHAGIVEEKQEPKTQEELKARAIELLSIGLLEK